MTASTDCKSGMTLRARFVRPAIYAQYIKGQTYPKGSIVYTDMGFYTNSRQTDQSPTDPYSPWKKLNIASVNLTMQRIGDCGVDFFFPPILPPMDGDLCDEPITAQVWKKGMIGTMDGKLYTPKVNSTSTIPPHADWSCGVTAEQLLAPLILKACNPSDSNLG